MKFGVSIQVNKERREIFYNNVKKNLYLGDEVRFTALVDDPDSDYNIKWGCQLLPADIFTYNGWSAILKIETAGRKIVFCQLNDERNKGKIEVIDLEFNIVRKPRAA